MQLSKSTTELLTSLNLHSQFKLTRQNDLGILIELSAVNNQHEVLEKLSFLAKFASKTMSIMTRIAKDGDGYDKLSHEFTETMGKATTLLNALLQDAPAPTRQQFSFTYLSLTPDSLQHLLALCYDLSWYKNWLIDHPDKDRHTEFP